MRVRPTLRGATVGAVGLVLVLLAVVIGSTTLLRLGLLGVVALVGAHVYAALTDPTRGPHGLEVERSVSPNPVSLGERATARVTVRAHGLGERILLAGLRLGEQAALELSGGRPLRARVERAAEHLTVTYSVVGGRRGRWELGPLDVRHADPLGLASVGATLGGVAHVTVWPRVVDLAVPPEALVGEPDRVALGARSPSTDDAALRDYREGDDLRRVHWRSTARRGQLMVRSDERAGMRPATVLLDLAGGEEEREWTVSLGASVALALLGAGHPARLVGGQVDDERHDPEVRRQHLRPGSPGARAELLDLTVDLLPGRSPAHDEELLVAAARTVAQAGTAEELVIAVLAPLGGAARKALGALGAHAECWAVVRTGPSDSPAARDAESSATELRRAGWRTVLAGPGEPVEDVWARLLGVRR